MGIPVTLNKNRLIFGLYLLVLIVAIDLILHHFHWPTWPVFMVMIFFFEAHRDSKRAPHLIVGGIVGVACYMLTVLFVELAGPIVGVPTARLIFICLVVYAIVALGEILPVIFNNYAFMFFLISGLAAQVGEKSPEPLLWMALTLVGGLVVIGGVMGIHKLMALFKRAS